MKILGPSVEAFVTCILNFVYIASQHGAPLADEMATGFRKTKEKSKGALQTKSYIGKRSYSQGNRAYTTAKAMAGLYRIQF